MNIHKSKGLVTLTVLGLVVSVSVLFAFGYVIALSVSGGILGGSLATWLCSGIRDYPTRYIDGRDTD